MIDNSLLAFSEFRDNLKNAIKHANGDESFHAKVIYEWKNKLEQETLLVKLSLTTIEYGRIGIEEGELLNTDNVHTEFDSRYQNYSLTDEKFFLIEGSSSRLGNYKVKILEI